MSTFDDELEYVDCGPVLELDGRPSEMTLHVLSGRSYRDEREAYLDALEEAEDQRYEEQMGIADECGIVLSVDGPDDPDPGREYTCSEPPATDQWPHHECGVHHKPEVIDCETAAEMRAVDEDLYRYARG